MSHNYGFILINKPVGPTSYDIVYKLRRLTGIEKIGHAGTLDPFASGLLIMAVGKEATKKIDQFVKKDKEYIATLRLGATTDTHDKTGHRQSVISHQSIKIEEIAKNLKEFVGKQKQIPPMHSAKKIKGKKLYELARQGITVERQPADIEIYLLELIEYNWPNLIIKVQCSSGTYIRALARDIGEKLGCGAYLEQLERISIGEYNIKNAVDLKQLAQEDWQKYLFN